jgi:hypothetical protein
MKPPNYARALRECIDRSMDCSHPKGWLNYWGRREQWLMEKAARHIERLEDRCEAMENYALEMSERG